jgi:phosphopantetheine adenylyltransferase/dephospho-CoA kinase
MTTKRVLLILTQSLNDIKSNLNNIIELSVSHASESLYVFINPTIPLKPAIIFNDRYLLKYITNNFYQKSFHLNPKLNINCLLSTSYKNRCLNYDLILTDLLQTETNSSIKNFCLEYLPSTSDNVKVVNIQKASSNNFDDLIDYIDHENDLIFANKSFDYSIVAGTFDRLHIGHKILLSESVLLTKKKLLIGITDEQMIQKKLLYELIEPLNIRIKNVTLFLNTIAPNLELEFSPLIDPFGPSITEKDYQCLIVSKETIKGGSMVNIKRVENKLDPMEIHVIGLIDDHQSTQTEHDELKVSSSNQRKRLLGTLLRDPYVSVILIKNISQII